MRTRTNGESVECVAINQTRIYPHSLFITIAPVCRHFSSSLSTQGSAQDFVGTREKRTFEASKAHERGRGDDLEQSKGYSVTPTPKTSSTETEKSTCDGQRTEDTKEQLEINLPKKFLPLLRLFVPPHLFHFIYLSKLKVTARESNLYPSTDQRTAAALSSSCHRR